MPHIGDSAQSSYSFDEAALLGRSIRYAELLKVYQTSRYVNYSIVCSMCQVVGMLLAASWQAISSYSLERLAGATNEPQHPLSHTNNLNPTQARFAPSWGFLCESRRH